jgi:signal transduction histidine kinase
MRRLAARAGWLPGAAILAVVAVNLAGFWSIAVARRGAQEAAGRAFQVEVAGRARAIEATLAAARADLAFLAASSPVSRLRLGSPGSVEEWRRGGAESALLLYLRGHPEVVRIVVRSASGEPLFHAGRRGGVPLLWVAASPTGLEGAAVAPGHPRLATRVAWSAAAHPPGAPPLALETEVEPAQLLPRDAADDTPWSCRLADAQGAVLARRAPLAPRDSTPPASGAVRAEAPVRAEDWSAASPWRLECEQSAAAAMGLVGPVAERYRVHLALSLAVMVLVLLLGGLAVQQLRRRERLEARAREEARVRELERQLFHAERLGTVGRLAAGIAHEINNPLEGMSNWLSLARDALERRRIEDAQGHLARVKEGLERAAGIVRQVLAHADPAKAPFATLDLAEVLREAGRLVQSRPEFRRIAFAFDIAAQPLPVRGNRVMLGQVAINLILNACEAQPGGGEVRIALRREGNAVLAEVADRGPGVAEADRERIFEPFFSTKDSTGLGLSICHTIVLQHGGELELGPREAGGSVFRLRLPEAAESGEDAGDDA